MWNASPITLRKNSVFLHELTIGQAMQIAKIPQSMNEARLSSFIGFVCHDDSLALDLTAQERYFILLNYLSLAQNDYVLNLEDGAFFINKNPKESPDKVSIDGLNVTHLSGRMAMVLEKKCENIYEWLVGQMACQISGDVGALLGFEDMIWENLPDDEYAIDEWVGQRFEQVENLSQSQFERLAEVYFLGCDKLSHCVKLGMDNEGLTLLSVGGETEQVARFCPDVCFGPTAERLGEYLAE